MASSDLRINAVGVVITFTVKLNGTAQDISGGTTTLTFTKPSGETVTKTPSFVTDGTDGQVKYTTESGFLDEAGTWRVYSYTDLTTTQYYSEVAEFEVMPVAETWQLYMRMLLRTLIDDDTSPYTYHDDKLDQLLVNAAYYVNMEVDFNQTYVIDVVQKKITPDPVAAKDEGFVTLVPLKAAVMVYTNVAKLASSKGFRVKDGPSEIDYRDAASGTRSMLNKAERAYEDAKVAYKTGKGMRGHAIVTPFHDSSWVADRDRR